MLPLPGFRSRFHFVARHGFTHKAFTPIERYTWDPLQLGPPPTVPPDAV